MGDRPAKSSKELKTAIHDDFKRQVIDDAKKRAVAQRVDYDTFKNMVSVAHLRPIQAPNEVRRDDGESWAFNCDGKRTPKLISTQERSVCASSHSFSLPTSQIQFVKAWRQRCRSPSDQLMYLKVCGVDCLRGIFRVELGGDVLGGILEALDLGRMSGGIDSEFAFNMIMLLSGLQRFSLNVRCLRKQAKDASTALLSWVDQELEWGDARRDDFEALRALFHHHTPPQ